MQVPEVVYNYPTFQVVSFAKMYLVRYEIKAYRAISSGYNRNAAQQ